MMVEVNQFDSHNANGLAMFDSCSTVTLTHQGIIDKEKLGKSKTKNNSISNMERAIRSINVETIGIRNQDDIGQNSKTQSEKLLQSDDRLSDIEIDTERAYIKEPVVSEQKEQRNYGQDQRVPNWQKTVSEHKHFPFGNRSASKCNNYIQVIKGTGQLITNLGYGRRTPIWQIEPANYLSIQHKMKVQSTMEKIKKMKSIT